MAYLNIKKINGFDDYYFPLDPENKTWSEVLDYLESALDDQYLKNDNKIEGIKLEFEIVSKAPEDMVVEE